MDTLEFVRDITFKMCDRDFDVDLVESTFAEDFVHHGNGATSDKAGYLARGREYREQFASIDRPEFDELFAVDDRVVVRPTRCSYTATTATPSAWRSWRSGPSGTARSPLCARWTRPRRSRCAYAAAARFGARRLRERMEQRALVGRLGVPLHAEHPAAVVASIASGTPSGSARPVTTSPPPSRSTAWWW